MAALVSIAVAFAGERVLDLPDRYPIHLPGSATLIALFNPQIRGFDNAVVGYAIMLVAAVAFALLAGPYVRDLPAPAAHPEAPLDREPRPRARRGPPAAVVAALLLVAAVLWGLLAWSVYRKHHELRYLLLLLASFSIVTGCLALHDRARGVSLRLRLGRGEAAGVLVLLVVCGAILSFDLTGIPHSMWGDEGAFGDAAKIIAVGDRPADLFEVGVYGFPLASSVYQAAFFELFGLRLWSWRLSSVAAVLASLIPLYFLVRAMYGPAIAALTLVLLTTSPFLLVFARSGYNNIQAVLPLTLALCLVYAAVERDSRTLFFVSGAAAGTVMVGILPWIRSLAGEADLNHKLFEWVLGAEMYVTSVFREVTLENNRWLEIGRLHVVLDAGLWARLLVRGVIRTMAAFHRTDLIEWHYISGSLGGP
ncbi:MAG TPA: glycosyltransferase family 39 protein, partial [Thermoanaerobaculia bacterium]|nr:glycosyltransferase family 39 protein [Thermoanaerobaculia bacterium]